MKTIMTKGAMLIALLIAASCSETEIGIEPEPDGGDGQVALGVAPNLKVDAGTKAATKSVVSGDAITYTEAEYTDAPGLGVVVTTKDVDGVYTPDGTAKHHIWYMGDAKGTNWKSIENKGSNFAEAVEVPYYLTKEVGRVYAYYPYSASVTFSISNESDLKIPVTVLDNGEIAATTNNAGKCWSNNAWASNSSADKATKLSVATETDYLFFAADGGGRYVNNGHAAGKTYDPNGEPDNTVEDNPGYKIKLDMQHAMAMVSFRVYDGGGLSTSAVNFTKFEIKNSSGGSSLFKTGQENMSLVNGAITNTSNAGSLTRTITDYVLMRQIEKGTQSASEFIQDGTKVNGKIVSKTVSTLVYPTDFSDEEIEVVITLKEGGNAAETYTVALPGIFWEAGQNYIYTFSAGRNKLTVMDVTVAKWQDNEQTEIPL